MSESFDCYVNLVINAWMSDWIILKVCFYVFRESVLSLPYIFGALLNYRSICFLSCYVNLFLRDTFWFKMQLRVKCNWLLSLSPACIIYCNWSWNDFCISRWDIASGHVFSAGGATTQKLSPRSPSAAPSQRSAVTAATGPFQLMLPGTESVSKFCSQSSAI